jgi:hypothetical protein
MLHLDLGTVLLIWVLVSALAHEYGHSFMAKRCGYKTFGFFAYPIPGVLMEYPLKEMHGILVLAGGWIFGVLSIPLFLPFVAPEYIIAFLITTLALETVLSTSDFMGILTIFFKKYNAKDMWSEYFFNVAKGHNQRAKYGLSKIVIVDRAKYEEILKESIQDEHSIAFLDKMDTTGWMVLLSLLALSSALMTALVNWPVFWLLSLLEVEIKANFLVLFWALTGAAFMLTITERLILHYHKK